jgi:hypothetical protein
LIEPSLQSGTWQKFELIPNDVTVTVCSGESGLGSQ